MGGLDGKRTLHPALLSLPAATAWSNEHGQDFLEPPLGAVLFTATGNYGSRLYDNPPGSRDFLEIAICDECLQSGQSAVLQVKRGVVSQFKP